MKWLLSAMCWLLIISCAILTLYIGLIAFNTGSIDDWMTSLALAAGIIVILFLSRG